MTISNSLLFIHSEKEFSGVVKIARKVCQDVELVFGSEIFTTCGDRKSIQKTTSPTQEVLFGTLGLNEELNSLARDGVIHLEQIRGKREVYGFFVLENTIVIVGSDKRGTIYGLFHLSELLGVSPLVNWAGMVPAKKTSFELTTADSLISKEPSVRYRGFFINDEWPAFGNWAHHRFGGFNATMYEQIFELLLRLKGNYLWPAMWASRFSDDGPGLANAELADELGVVMGASHHEPCCRAGEEYKYLRGPNSIYGDDWNFRTNREGITRFWEDGLKRNGKFENVITLGMRGEADTAILGKQSTLKDNIDLLRDVIATQNRLIKSQVNEDLHQVPRMLALYKEVEPYYYGDDQTHGLIDDPELHGVTLMLCDDNHGNLRTLPTESMRSHKGGYGMYYHFDYHGSPYSYEWLNTNHLPKVKEQMTMAYDFGIRELWVVNVGDMMTNEFPLSYFLDLAYDVETYSTHESTITKYTETWVRKQFPTLTYQQQFQIADIIAEYTKLAHLRRTECLQPDTFHPQHFGEADLILAKAEAVIAMAEQLKKELPEELYPGYFSQVYFPACGTMNILRMQLLSGKNQWFARHGAIAANTYAKKVRECFNFDQALVSECDTVAHGKWYAMGWSEHFGFTHWCEGENRYPVYMEVEPTRKNRAIVWVEGSSITTTGQDWTRKTLKISDFKNPTLNSATVWMAECSIKPIEFAISISCYSNYQWITTETRKDEETGIHKITLWVDRAVLSRNQIHEAKMTISYNDGNGKRCFVEVLIDAQVPPESQYKRNTFIQTEEWISIEAEHFTQKVDGSTSSFQILHNYGKTLSALKAFPTTKYYTVESDTPLVEYLFVPTKEDNYNLCFYLNPSNPVTQENKLQFTFTINNRLTLVDVVDSSFAVGDDQEPWSTDVTNNIRIVKSLVPCIQGVNQLIIQPVTPGFVLEKIVLYPANTTIAYSYLGPPETYRIQ
jgi:hypothetical protein